MQRMVDGVVDEFEDQDGLASVSSGTYNADLDVVLNDLSGATGSDLLLGRSATASSFISGYPASAAVDGNDSTSWIGQASAFPATLTIALDAATAVSQYAVTFKTQAPYSSLGNAPAAWTLEGLADGIWRTLDSRSGQSFADGETKTFDTSQALPVESLRLTITASVGGTSVYPMVSTFEAWTGTFQNMTVTSQAFTADTEPDELLALLFLEDEGDVAENTDVRWWGSIDGGATWAEATLVDQGDYESGRRILAGTADVSGQTGTSVVWQIGTYNNKAVVLHGTAVEWR